MAISQNTKRKALDRLLNEKTTIYVSIPSNSPNPSADLPNAVINFGSASGIVGGAEAKNTNAIQIVAAEGTIIDKIYLSTTPLTNQTTGNEFARIELTDDDIETYDTNGIYLINTITIQLI